MYGSKLTMKRNWRLFFSVVLVTLMFVVVAFAPLIFHNLPRDRNSLIRYWLISIPASIIGILMGIVLVVFSRKNPQRYISYLDKRAISIIAFLILLVLGYIFGRMIGDISFGLLSLITLYIFAKVTTGVLFYAVYHHIIGHRGKPEKK